MTCISKTTFRINFTNNYFATALSYKTVCTRRMINVLGLVGKKGSYFMTEQSRLAEK